MFSMLGLAGVVVFVVVVVRAALKGSDEPRPPPPPPLSDAARELLTRLGFEKLDDDCWTRDESTDGVTRTLFFDLPEGDPPYQNLWVHTKRAPDALRAFLGAKLMAWPQGSEPRWNIDEGEEVRVHTVVLEPDVQVRIEVQGRSVPADKLEQLVNLVRPRAAALAQLPKGYLELEFELKNEENLEWKLNLYWVRPQVESPYFDNGVALLTAAADDISSSLT